MREEAMLTVLPHGSAEGGRLLRASIYVTPRLEADGGAGVLGDFGAFVRWADTIRQLLDGGHVSLHFDDGPTLVAEPDPDLPAQRPDPALWDLLLPPTTPVRSRAMLDLADRRWRSFPFDEVLDGVRDLYATVAADSPFEFPDRGRLTRKFGRLGVMARNREELEKHLEGRFERVGDSEGSVFDRSSVGSSSTMRQLAAYGQARRFYDRPGTRIGKADAVPARPAQPELDFHDACTALADHPELLRRLGLVVDVLVPSDVPQEGRVRVDRLGRLAGLAGEGMRPWTRYVRRDDSFRAEERPSGDHREGMLHLDRERHVVTDLDVDGSSLKVFEFSATVSELAKQSSAMDAPGESLPALRNAGMTVARVDRATGLAKHVVAVRAREKATVAGTPAELWADDLVRGYRVDVRDDRTGRWWSLCRRVGTYLVDRDGGVRLEVAPDEGYVKVSTVTSTPDALPGSDDDLYLHEALFGWDGWSLVAPRPGVVFPTYEGEVTAPPATAPNPCALTTAFAPQPGSLPALRFGRTYEVRARAVDLSGTSWGLDDAGVPTGTTAPPHTYRRWEPVPAPTLLPRRPFGEGESIRRLVIRSTVGETPASYVALPRVRNLVGHETTSGADGLDRSYVDTDERHVLPPKSALQQVEQHGGLDAAIGDRPQSARDAVLELARREAGTIFDLPGAAVVNLSATPTALPLPTRGQPLQQGEQVVVDRAAIDLPYLADVLARGAALTGVPGEPSVLRVPFGTWPDQPPFRIVLGSGPLGHRWTQGKRTLVVRLPPAEVARLRLSCHLRLEDLDLLAVWHLLPEQLQEKYRELAVNGQHWMLTPAIELTLVHAVEKPMADPVLHLTTGSLHRLSGETFASLTGTMTLHAKSTGRVDVAATWTEPVDDVMLPGPTTLDGRAHVADLRVEPDEDTLQLGRDEDPDAAVPVHRARHEFGDTKHRFVTYDALATTRFREYFPPEITERPELITEQGPGRAVHVRSSRRPEPPEVLYVVPTFRWDTAGAGTRRTRNGGGLRVYLARPWWSSGADEHLAVVLPDQTPPIRRDEALVASLDDDLLRDAVRRLGVRGLTTARLREAISSAAVDRQEETSAVMTQLAAASMVVESGIASAFVSGDTSAHVTWWGSDPIWASSGLPKGPRIQSFTNADRWDTGLSLAEVPFGRVAVAAYVPQYDEERRLWFVDIDIDAGDAYFPFVRLALARYQPYSIPGAELSRVVPAEWAQLTADRTTTVRRLQGMARITVEGIAGVNDLGEHLGSGGVERSHLVVAQVERIRGSGDVGWTRVGDRVTLELAEVEDGEARWTGRVPLPDASGTWRYRLAVEEHELYETDPSQAEFWETTLTAQAVDFGAFGTTNLPSTAITPVRSRLVYADHFPLGPVRGGGLGPVAGPKVVAARRPKRRPVR